MSEPVRIGVVGYGLGGRVFHAPLIASPELELVGVVTQRRPAAPSSPSTTRG